MDYLQEFKHRYEDMRLVILIGQDIEVLEYEIDVVEHWNELVENGLLPIRFGCEAREFAVCPIKLRKMTHRRAKSFQSLTQGRGKLIGVAGV